MQVSQPIQPPPPQPQVSPVTLYLFVFDLFISFFPLTIFRSILVYSYITCWTELADGVFLTDTWPLDF